MKKKMTVLNICICAAMIAIHIVLETFLSIRIGETLKITFSTLPFVVVGMLCGPAEGFITGIVGSFLSQLLGPYGIMVTTWIWIIPGAMEGLTAGLVFKAFKRKPTVPAVAVSVFAAGFVLTVFNWFGSYLGSIVILKEITIEGLLAVTPIRLLKWIIVDVIYTIIMIPLTKTLLKTCPAGIKQARLNAAAAAEAPASVEVEAAVPAEDTAPAETAAPAEAVVEAAAPVEAEAAEKPVS